MPSINVDGKNIEAKPGQTVLQACLDAGITLPHYCYHPGLSIPASCRICLVEVEGLPKLVPSCQTPIRDGMVVHATSHKAIANQKQVMEYLLINHPLDCPVCDQAGECGLQDYSYEYGRSQSRFEEDKAKKPKKDVGDNIYLYADRCIMCTRCVRFTREVSGTSELFVEGRGHKESISIFPGQPLNNKLAGNVVDLCPVGALLDKDFLFKQRVWLLKRAVSISPVDSGGENIYLEHNEGVIYRVKPRYNAEVNRWWISDDTRYSYRAVHDRRRLKTARATELGGQVDAAFATALDAAVTGFHHVVARHGPGSTFAVLSPMMSCEEAWLFGRAMRSIDPEAMLVLGPVPSGDADEVFTNPQNGKTTFTIKAEKVPNAAGVRRILGMLGGPQPTWADLVSNGRSEIRNVKAGWVVGGYLTNWVPLDPPEALRRRDGKFLVVQDILPNAATEAADVVLPAAAWAEKDGAWENHAGRLQAFAAAVPPPEGVRREGDVYYALLGRPGVYNAADVRAELGEPFAAVTVPAGDEPEPAMEFAEL
jgi:NADH-quinone oxidoreductase subunit G